MQSSREAAARLMSIDELQDDLLRQLDELERRTEAVLAECLATTPATVAGRVTKRVAMPGQRAREAA